MSASFKNPEIDELLAKVWSKHTNILPELDFLNSVFTFMNQRSAYLSEPNNLKKAQNLLNKHAEDAKELKKKKEQEKEQKETTQTKNQAKETKETSTSTTASTEPATSTTTKEMATSTTDTATATATATSTSSENDSKSAEKKTKSKSDDGSSDDDDDAGSTEKKEDKSHLLEPINNGGVTDKYVWTQSLHDVEIRVPIPANFKGKDLKVTIEPRKVTAGIKGKPPIINGELHDVILVPDSTWTLEQERGKTEKTLTIGLKKETGMCWWRRAFIGDPEIDTAKIEPENSGLEELDPETKRSVEKVMVEQRQKMMGIPTQKEIEQQQMIEKLKKQFPEMDFSQTKFA